MKCIARAIGLLLGFLPAIALGQVPSYPATLPANTVVGRLGIGAGPSQAVPFANIGASLGPYVTFQQPDTGAGPSRSLQSKLSDTINPIEFGVKCDGATDDTAAFGKVATAVNARGGGVIINMPAGKTCFIWPNASGAPASSLMTFTVSGVTILWNGSALTTDNSSFSSSNVNAIVYLSNADNFEEHGFNYSQPNALTLNDTKGARGVYIVGSSSHVRLYGSVMNGGRSFIEDSAASAWQTQSPRSHDIVNIGLNVSNVYYAQNFQGNGDQYFARDVTCNNVGRCYFPWNVNQHDVEMTSNAGGPFNDLLIKTYADPAASAAGNTTSNIRARYRNIARQNSTASQSLVALEFQQNTSTTTAGYMRNIDIQLDLNRDSNGQPVAVNTYKFDSTGTADSTTRGYVMENVSIGGVIQNWADSNATLDLFNATNGSFAGETCRNIFLRNFDVYGSSVTSNAMNVDASCVTANLVTENINSSVNLNVSNGTSNEVWTRRNVWTANYFADRATAYTQVLKNSVTGTPPSGTIVCGADSTNNVPYCVNDSGNKSIMITPNAGTTHQFATGISAAGVLSTAQPACADVSNAGTACTQNTGTSGANVPLLNGANTWASTQVFSNGITTNAASTFNVPSNNIGAFNFNVQTSSNQIGFEFSDNGTTQWNIYKNTDNTLNFYDNPDGANVLTLTKGTSSTATFAVQPTTPATSSSTGALQSKGGMSAAGAIWAGTYIDVTPTVVNSLPTCTSGLDGARAYVTNNATAVSFGGAVTSGGTTHSPVYCDGSSTSWKQG